MAKQDLIPFNQRTEEEQKKIAIMGGKASGRSRLAKKRGRELVQMMLSMKVTDDRIIKELASMGIVTKDMINEVAMNARQIDKAIKKADTEAYKAVYKAAGYDDKDSININISDEKPPVIIFGTPESQEPEEAKEEQQ